jgi:chemotaxis protein MotB
MKKKSKAKILFLSSFISCWFLNCGVDKALYQKKLDEIKKLQGRLQSEIEQRKALEIRLEKIFLENKRMAKRLQELGEDVSRLRTERGTLASDLEAARRREEELRRLQAQAAARLATFKKLIKRFKSLREAGKLKVKIVRNKMVVEMKEDVLFDSGRYELKEEGKATLREVAKVLATIKNRDFQVAGHTDNVPIRRHNFTNWELSTRRAVTVVKFLIQNGVNPKHLSAAGHSEYQPVADNRTPEGKAKNRRIEIVLMPNLDELPDLSMLEAELEKEN